MEHTTTTPAIPSTEYARRIDRLQIAMREQNLNAILLGTGANLHYWSGFPSPAQSVPRPFFLLVPAAGVPIFFTHFAFLEECRLLSAVEDVRYYEGLSRVPTDVLIPAISGVTRTGGRLGMELGYEQSLDISIAEFQRFTASLGHTELVDAAALLWRQRMIKSEAEIECLRAACRHADGCYRRTFSSSCAGMTEDSIYRNMQRELQESGGDTFLVITSGPGNYDMISKPPSTREVCPGNMVWMDAGCRIHGYWSDFSRAATVGPPSPEQERAQKFIADTTAETVRMIRPGMRCSEVARFALSRLEDFPFPITSSLALRAGRIGHGIGLKMTEPPHLGLHDDTIFEPGMVVSVEPGVATKFGAFHVEENVVVREDGCELLTAMARELQALKI